MIMILTVAHQPCPVYLGFMRYALSCKCAANCAGRSCGHSLSAQKRKTVSRQEMAPTRLYCSSTSTIMLTT
ncbi:uncharacterized protein BO66DRAFT_53112 [Aspergillus aculeatinus CBS 121060]|uniref:Uncharacterized protein n=1 Tax=Aspergillus aculeatinus CBS 121060 TaxID=1448322 RepID=A0ACD1HDY7_9EURO|nr:hypothetical protein BO66DRAFT_53112 [Aspergillus aculeatinus CBS 121060]RAH71606.1 hypothetical protein BO66DRAFT_53112 [Aspergillus aculeatinus CBS 121060]